jgi:hypothetical protein
MINGTLPEQCNIDLQIGAKWVRMGYHTTDCTNAAAVQALLENDAAILNNADKQHDTQAELGATPSGTDRPDLVPDPFDV